MVFTPHHNRYSFVFINNVSYIVWSFLSQAMPENLLETKRSPLSGELNLERQRNDHQYHPHADPTTLPKWTPNTTRPDEECFDIQGNECGSLHVCSKVDLVHECIVAPWFIVLLVFGGGILLPIGVCSYAFFVWFVVSTFCVVIADNELSKNYSIH